MNALLCMVVRLSLVAISQTTQYIGLLLSLPLSSACGHRQNRRHFTDIGPIMLSLLQFVLIDNAADIYYDLVSDELYFKFRSE